MVKHGRDEELNEGRELVRETTTTVTVVKEYGSSSNRSPKRPPDASVKVEKIASAKCGHKTPNGKFCLRDASVGALFCWQHDPDEGKGKGKGKGKLPVIDVSSDSDSDVEFINEEDKPKPKKPKEDKPKPKPKLKEDEPKEDEPKEGDDEDDKKTAEPASPPPKHTGLSQEAENMVLH